VPRAFSSCMLRTASPAPSLILACPLGLLPRLLPACTSSRSVPHCLHRAALLSCCPGRSVVVSDSVYREARHESRSATTNCIVIRILLLKQVRPLQTKPLGLNPSSSGSGPLPRAPPPPGLYTILPFSILYSMYCNKGWPGGNTVLRNSVGDNGGGCPNKRCVCE